MAVHVIMPVHNRLAMTRSMVTCLRAQECEESIHIIVVDDGSHDGTAEFLAGQNDITTLSGNGDLWWGGAVDLALHHVARCARAQDWVLLINNDTKIRANFVQTLVEAALRHPRSVLGSVIRDEQEPHPIVSIGARIDPWRLSISDLLTGTRIEGLREVVEVDAISGRGALFPIAAIRDSDGMRPRLLPHYFADYEFSLRLKRAGWRLLVHTGASVYSSPEYGTSTYRPQSLIERFTSVRSPSYLPAVAAFWWQASTWRQRLSLPIRALAFAACPNLRRFI